MAPATVLSLLLTILLPVITSGNCPVGWHGPNCTYPFECKQVGFICSSESVICKVQPQSERELLAKAPATLTDCVCRPGFTGPHCSTKIEFCPAIQDKIVCSHYYWPETNLSTLARLNCSVMNPDELSDQYISRRCSDRGVWDKEADYSRCDLRSLASSCENPMERSKILAESIKSIHDDLNELSKSQDVSLLSKQNIIRRIDVVIEYDETLGPRLVDLVTSNKWHGSKPLEYSGDNLGVFSTGLSSDEISTMPVLRVNSETSSKMGVNESSMEQVVIPRDVLEIGKSGGEVTVSVITYKYPSSFYQSGTAKNQSKVVSVHVSGVENERFENYVEITFGSPPDNGDDPTCAYLDEHRGTWSTRGVTTQKRGNQIICQSNHLTSFSVLFDPVGLEFSVADDHALTMLSLLLGFVSIICLILTIVVYSLSPSLRDQSGKVLLQLCLSLASLNITVLIPSISPTYQITKQCVMLAVLIHYLTLVALSWMMAEALNLFQLLIKVFATEESWFLRKRIFFCWGVPILLVAITVGADINRYLSAVNVDSCVITAQQPLIYYLSFFGPGCVILLINCVIFVSIIRVVFGQRTSNLAGRQTVTSKQIAGVLTVMSLLGIGWTLGVLQVGRTRVVFAYLFVLVNGSQGIVIFIMRCLLHPPVRRNIQKLPLFSTFHEEKSSSQLDSQLSAVTSGSGRSWWRARWNRGSQSTELIIDEPSDSVGDRIKVTFKKACYRVNV